MIKLYINIELFFINVQVGNGNGKHLVSSMVPATIILFS